ncbi:MAG: S8 family serine peptidase [Eubacterium sp.]|nr:S8 family serine peptidase [Eubacterium sp.]
MFCEYCGNKLDDGSVFCPECGNPVGQATPTGNVQNRTKVTFPIYDNATMPINNVAENGVNNGTRVYTPQQITAGNQKNKKVKGKKSPSKKRFRKRIIAIVLAVFILVGSIGGYFIWRSMRNVKDEAYFKPFAYEDIEFPESGNAYIKNELILTGSKDSSFKKIKKLAEEMTGKIVGYVSMSNDYQIEFDDEKSKEELDEIISDWSANDLVASVDYHYVYETDGSIFDYSNDEWWNYQDGDKPDDFEEDWDIYAPYGNNWGVESVWMPKVWEMDQDFKPVKVGIIDTMFDMSHPDLDKKFKKAENNPESIEYDVATGTDTYLYHGTHVAGIIGATIDNGVGIAGVAQNAELYGFAMAAPDGTLYTSMMEWKAAIGTQLIDGVKAINISMDVTLNDPAEMEQLNSEIEDFLRVCLNKEYYFLIFKAADNAENPTPGFITEIKPGTVRDHIIVVGGAECVYDSAGSLQGYKAIGDEQYQAGVGEQIDIYAPGVEVDSDVPGGLTENHDGTSVAAPFVAGEAALIWGVNPELTCNEVRDIILNNYIYEVTVNGGDSGVITRPYANAYRAVDAAIKTVDKNYESEDVSTKTDAAIDVEDNRKADYEYDEQLYAPFLRELKETVKEISTRDNIETIYFEAADFELEEDGQIVDNFIAYAPGTNGLSGEYYWFDDIDGDGTDELFFSDEPQEIEDNGKRRMSYPADMFVAKTETGYKLVNLYTYIRGGVEYLGNGVFLQSNISGANGHLTAGLYSYNNSHDLDWFADFSGNYEGDNSSEDMLYEGELKGYNRDDWIIANELQGEAARKRWEELIDENTADPHPWANIERRNINDYNGESSDNAGDWKQAYVDILNGFEYIGKDSYTTQDIYKNNEWDIQYINYSYSDDNNIYIAYIDDDDIPELVFYDYWNVYVISYRNGQVVRYNPTVGENSYGNSVKPLTLGFSDRKGVMWIHYGPMDAYDSMFDIWDYYDISEERIIAEGVYNYNEIEGTDLYYAWREIKEGDTSKVDLYNESEAKSFILTLDDYNKKKAEYENRYNIPSGADGSETKNYSYTKEEAVTYIQGL